MNKVVPHDAVLIPDSAACVFSGIIYDVYQWQQTLFDGSSTTFEMLRRPDTVVAVCIVEDRILLVSDTQPHRGRRFTLPGGRVEPGESALAAIQREVQEETGYVFTTWHLVDVRQPAAKLEWFVNVYVGYGVAHVSIPHTDPGERIKVLQKTLDEMSHLAHTKDSTIAETRHLFESVRSTQELCAILEYKGQVVDR